MLTSDVSITLNITEKSKTETCLFAAAVNIISYNSTIKYEYLHNIK